MHKKVKDKRPVSKIETIFETEHRLRGEAILISKTFVHTKPIKFLLK
ncbi:hypothetical protein SAMN05444355_10745 [Flavobacterium frigoris]|uniref:Uncharacterized protein n=1 Tax=Flavobacterium frigoris TaxID=229204 RepID=A0A1H9LIL1_FLAFI|nr:hypothetical protein SAMN05444355_10745 [Flavobacterium frigoris]